MKLWKIFGKVSRSTTFIMILIFVLGLTTTFWAWKSAVESTNQTVDDSTIQKIETLEKYLDERVISYENFLEGGSGLFYANNGDITKLQWSNYAAAYHLDEKFPAIEALGYVENFPSSQLEEHQNKIRGKGSPDYKVISDISTENYSVVVYLAPETPTSPIGYNMLSDPIRAQTLSQARESNKAAVSPILTLTNKSKGFIMIYPLYKTEINMIKNENIGYVYLPVNLNKLLEAVRQKASIENFQFAVSEGDNESNKDYIYKTADYTENNQDLVSKALSIYTRKWTIHANLDRSSESYNSVKSKPLIVLVVGVLTTTILSISIGQVLRARYKHIARLKENELEKSRDELLSLASHQLRTPATAVKHYVGMMLEGYGGKIDKRQREFLNRAYTANERQLEIVNQILHISRIESGMLELTNKPVDMGKIARKIIITQKKTLKDKKQKIKTSIENGLPLVLGDGSYLEIVFENLLTNASKYTPEKGNISVSLYASDTGVIIEVSDTGVGIDQKDMNQLFKKFSRIHNELSISSGGSGVGLYLSKLIIELHGGEIEAISRVGIGTTFRVKLPIMSQEL